MSAACLSFENLPAMTEVRSAKPVVRNSIRLSFITVATSLERVETVFEESCELVALDVVEPVASTSVKGQLKFQ